MPGQRDSQRVWEHGRTAPESARAALPLLAARYYADGRKALRTHLSHRKLHRFRLKTKRFRYTLELFRVFYGPTFDRLLARLREIQTHLGKMSDCASMELLFHKQPRLATSVRQRADKHAAEFRAYWKGDFDAEGEEERWFRYLGRRSRR